MTKRTQRVAIWAAVIAVSSILALVVCQFAGHKLASLPLKQIAIVVMLAGLIGALIRMQFADDLPDVWDLVREDSEPHKLSLSKSITLVCCIIGLWYAIAIASDPTFDPKDRAGTFLLQLVLIFVVYRGTNQAVGSVSAAMRNRQVKVDVSDDGNTVTKSVTDFGVTKLPSTVRGADRS